MPSYDEIPYPLYSHSQTHPAELATLATLHNLTPAPVASCRVLEIGCASGGNLVPMAYGLPSSQLVGIDYSARQIEEGQKYVDALGLTNIKLIAQNLLDFDYSLGQFDYIIAHGFYSWVPPVVREKLFEVCQRCLTPQGVAYISYNAYPGWKALSAIRDILLFRIKGVESHDERIGQAHHMLEFLAEFTSAAQRVSSSITYAHAEYLKTVLQTTKSGEDAYVQHDILEETNDPVYFHQFMTQAESNDLQYLTDSDFRISLPNIYPKVVADELNRIAHNRIEWEQYCDFLANRMFRQTLLCHTGFPVNFKLTVDNLRSMRFGCGARAEENVEITAIAKQKFTAVDGATLTTDHPVSKAGLHYLISIYPQTATLAEVYRQAEARVGGPRTVAPNEVTDEELLASNLLNGFMLSSRLVNFTMSEPQFVTTVSERPIANPWARLQAPIRPTVTTLRHARYALDPYEQFILPLLDGTNTVDDIVEKFVIGPVASGELAVMQAEEAVTDPQEIRTLLANSVRSALNSFAHAPLLIA